MPKTILIIEDEKSVRTLLARLFTREGFSVLTAEGIEAARELISGADLILSDIRLGDGNNGIEFLEELRRRGIETPALLMSGFLIDSEIEKAIELTGRPVIPKPTNFQEVLKIVEKALAEKD